MCCSNISHGKSQSVVPYVRRAPANFPYSAEDINGMICQMAKKGVAPSKIGLTLRDQYGVGQVSHITGNKIVRILRANGLAPEIPEDLYCLIKRAVAIRSHLERNRRDKDSKFRLILVESRIYRIVRYYKSTRALPATFRYSAQTAGAIVAK